MFKDSIKNHLKKTTAESPRSYRLNAEIVEVLNQTLKRVNKISPRKISEARLVKGLILLSKEIDDEQLIKAVKDVW